MERTIDGNYDVLNTRPGTNLDTSIHLHLALFYLAECTHAHQFHALGRLYSFQRQVSAGVL